MSTQTQQVLSGQTMGALATGLYEAASAKAFYNSTLFLDVRSTFSYQPHAFGGPHLQQQEQKKAAILQVPDLEKLFGSQSFCECEHCRSVYSPAAYLVDLLHLFLDDTTRKKSKEGELFGDLNYPDPSVDPGPPIAQLLKRRPDLVKIPLTCENTNTPLPYIDLVNEALESFIDSHLVGGSWSDTPQSKDTITAYDTGSTPADELRAVPQNVDPHGTVYPHLANEAVYPMTLPFDRSLEIVRAYLAHLGTSRAELMEVFQAPLASDPKTLLPGSYDIAIETLKLSPAQAKIISGADGKSVWEYYGYPSASDLVSLNNTPNKVPEFLHRTGIDLNDLLELLKTKFINPHINDLPLYIFAIRIQYPEFPDDACDITKMKFLFLASSGETDSHPNLDHIHRFIRLWRALGWTMADLDKALIVLGNELNSDTLEKLASVKQLTTDLDCPVAKLLPLWGDISRWGEPSSSSSYSEMFLSAAIISDQAERNVFKTFKEPDGTTAQVNDHLPAVAAALAITTDDLTRIRSYLDAIKQPLSADLGLTSLSVLCRYGTLAKALDIRVRDLITLLSVAPVDANPFADSDPRPAVKFVQLAQTVLDSGFSIPLINYLFRGEAEPTRHPAPTRELIENTFKELQNGLSAIWQETVMPEQPTVEDLRAALDLAKNLLGDKDATGKLVMPLSPDEVLAVLDPRVNEFNGQPLVPSGQPPGLDRQAFVTKHFSDFLSQPDQDVLFDSTFLSDPSEKRLLENVSTVLSALLPWLRVKEQELLVTQTMAAATGVGDKAASALLKDKVEDKHLLHSKKKDDLPALHDFLSLIDDSGNAVAFDVDATSVAPVATFISLFKAAAYITAFAMTEPELKLFASSSTPAKINLSAAPLDFNQFPLATLEGSDQQPQKHFDLWQKLAKYYRLREALPKSEKTLPDFFASLDLNVTPDARLKVLVEVTGWEQTLVEALLAGFKIHVKDLADVDRLSNLHRAERLTKRLGANLKQKKDDTTQLEEPNPFAWAAVPSDRPQADAIVQIVKARYERAQWLDVAHGLNDPMREKQRHAIVAFLIPRIKAANFDFKTPNDLLEYFLIDVEMTSCMLTSRIKQAISSVQLFIQRCLLNLEPAVSPDEIDVDWWEWMKNYRIWEANRKVFLYPENWIEPELRDDKTPFFKDLETELLQNELTDDTVETALINYLYKLDEVARLDIRGFCKEEKEENDETKEIYHVFGRTWNPPYVYYYRRGTFPKGEPNANEWTPWEKVDLDIEGDHLIPVVYEGRLYLFWLLFEEKHGPLAFNTTPDTDSASTHSAMKLAWVEREGTVWSRKRVASEGTGDKIEQVWVGKPPDGSFSPFGGGIVWSSGPMEDPFGKISDSRMAYWVNPNATDTRLTVDVVSYNGFYWIYYGTYGLACGTEMTLLSPKTGWDLLIVLYQFAKHVRTGRTWSERVESAGQSFSLPLFAQDRILTAPYGSRITPCKQDVSPPFWFQDGPAGSQTYFARPVTVWLPPVNVHEKTQTAINLYTQQVSPRVKEKAYSEVQALAGGSIGHNVIGGGG